MRVFITLLQLAMRNWIATRNAYAAPGSTTGPVMAEMIREVAENVTQVRIPNAAHWVPKENPQALLASVCDFAA
jgi:pimeloyl-ACP methyl ester carboxylesterase